MQKSLSSFNLKGITLALKNLGLFSSPTASRAVRGVNIKMLTYTYNLKH
jgi:hypothetical protein